MSTLWGLVRTAKSQTPDPKRQNLESRPLHRLFDKPSGEFGGTLNFEDSPGLELPASVTSLQ